MKLSEAQNFVETHTSQQIADEVGDLFSGENLSKALEIGGKFLPKDGQKGLSLAQVALTGKLKGLMSGDAGAIGATIGALSKFLPPELARIIGKAGPILSKGIAGLSGTGGNLSNLVSADGLLGIAAQFLPPWCGDAMAAAKNLAGGDIAGAVDGLLSKYLPPELKAAYAAIKNASGGLKGLMADLFDKPKSPQSGTGFWAARVSDAVVCAGGVGVIDSGFPTVIIGGQFAARATDTAACNGVPKTDVIMLGEPTIRFGGHFASRITDQTAHGGTITTGFPTVHLSKSLGQCESCLSAASAGGASAGSAGAGAGAGGAATISGAGITSPFGSDSILGDTASGVGDKLKDFAVDKVKDFAGNQSQKLFGAKDEPKPQPKIFDDENGGMW
jgi:uncharacterized Zn-binding protein involved in type VI secretion